MAKCVAANPVRFGTVVFNALPTGTTEKYYPVAATGVNVDTVWNAKLTNRFDDPRYYTGDPNASGIA